jgi:hypothetical protein
MLGAASIVPEIRHALNCAPTAMAGRNRVKRLLGFADDVEAATLSASAQSVRRVASIAK